jgi:hypothetical protein
MLEFLAEEDNIIKKFMLFSKEKSKTSRLNKI